MYITTICLSDVHVHESHALGRESQTFGCGLSLRIEVWALETTSHAKELETTEFPDGPLALVLGHESYGVSASALKACDEHVCITTVGIKRPGGYWSLQDCKNMLTTLSSQVEPWDHFYPSPSLFTSLRDGNRPHRMEGANISTEHSPGSAPPLPNVAEHRFHVSR